MLFLLFQNAIFYTIALSPLGRVAEWLNAAVLKTADAQAFVGSNPTPSANHIEPNVFAFGFFLSFFMDWYGNLGHKEVQDYVYTRVNQTTSL